MGNQLASRHTGQTFTATGVPGALTVASGEPVTVHGITFTSETIAVFTITDAADVQLFTIELAADSSFNHEISWKADAGIKVQSNQTDGNVIVFHDGPGN